MGWMRETKKTSVSLDQADGENGARQRARPKVGRGFLFLCEIPAWWLDSLTIAQHDSPA